MEQGSDPGIPTPACEESNLVWHFHFRSGKLISYEIWYSDDTN